MKRVTVLAERAAGLSLKLIAALNLLFLAAFLAALLAAMSHARAGTQAPACPGDNLLAAMERDEPALLASIRAEAAKVENGSGLLWRIEKEGVRPSFLFGTMHLSDPRVVALDEAVQAALDAAGTLVIETTEVLDPTRMAAAMLANPELTMFTDDTTLWSLMSADDRAMAETALSERGIPPGSVRKMKPWMIAAMVAMPACELARKAGGAPVLDVMLAGQAQAAGKRIEGLETVAEQLGAMASLPLDLHVRGLVETLRLGDAIDDVMETMIALYLEGETGAFWPFFRAALPSGDGEDEAGFVAFEEAMVTARNRTMATRALPFLDAGGAFVAVGALHLPGPEGLVAALRAAGYRVSPVGR